jgi:hypothetical protein
MRTVTVMVLLAIIGATYACSSVPSDSRIGVATPDRTQFPPVGDFLTHRCGELDCHGNAQRNFKVYGCEGLRLDSKDTPGCPSMLGPMATATTDAEYDATFRSFVGLEPAVVSNVVKNGGKNPELLTLVRKMRGEESHKGGTLVTPGDDQDVCVTSWIAGQVDADACKRAIAPPMMP